MIAHRRKVGRKGRWHGGREKERKGDKEIQKEIQKEGE